MSNTVKIKSRKKKKQQRKLNHKLLAIIFGIFVALIVGISVWAAFHWGVGMGTIGQKPSAENAGTLTTDVAAESATESVVLTPEQLEQMGITLDDLEKAGAEIIDNTETAAEDAGAEEAGAEEAGADGADAEKAADK